MNFMKTVFALLINRSSVAGRSALRHFSSRAASGPREKQSGAAFSNNIVSETARKSAARLSSLHPARYVICVIYANLRRDVAPFCFPFFLPLRDDERAPGKIASEQIMTLVSRKLLVAAGSFAIPRGNLLAIKHGAGIVRTEITVPRNERRERDSMRTSDG